MSACLHLTNLLITKKLWVNLKPEHIVVYGNSSDDLKSKTHGRTERLFLNKKFNSYSISHFWHMVSEVMIKYVSSSDNNNEQHL